jgi:hypothetical protein
MDQLFIFMPIEVKKLVRSANKQGKRGIKIIRSLKNADIYGVEIVSSGPVWQKLVQIIRCRNGPRKDG